MVDFWGQNWYKWYNHDVTSQQCWENSKCSNNTLQKWTNFIIYNFKNHISKTYINKIVVDMSKQINTKELDLLKSN